MRKNVLLSHRNSILCLLLALMFALSSCASQEQVVLDDIRIGIVPIFQPENDTQLLAGHFIEPRALATTSELESMQNTLDTLTSQSTRQIAQLKNVNEEDIRSKIPKNSTRGMLAYWNEYAKIHKIEFLFVPYLYYYNDKANSHSLHQNNALVLDFFLLDTRENGAIAQRIRYAVIEEALPSQQTFDMDFNSLQILDDEKDMQSLIDEAFALMQEHFQL